MTANWTIRRADSFADIAQCLSIREVVFVNEQGVSPALERDGLDDDSLHYIAFDEGNAVATARVRVMEACFKFQRVAVLGQARGTGLGAALMRFVLNDMAQRKDAVDRYFFLSSQASAVPFYEKLGFAVCSGEYIEADIPHFDMRMDIQLPTNESSAA